jgi:hypothetical protein
MHTTSWRKSSRSSNSGDNNCLEARVADGQFQVRDSKLGEDSPIFSLDREQFKSVLRAAQR